MRYRWAVLGAGSTAMASAAVLFVGLPVLAPMLREEFALSLSGVGVLLATAWVGGSRLTVSLAVLRGLPGAVERTEEFAAALRTL